MSSTRHASEGSAFRQERYMSSPEMQRGLLANCVAARVQALADPAHRRLIWWLQKVSWEAGGLEQLANEIIQRWPERFATATMQRLGTAPGRIYNAEEVKEARKSLHGSLPPDPFEYSPLLFPLKGELVEEDLSEVIDCILDHPPRRQARKESSLPDQYPARAFTDYCLKEAREELAKFFFENLCLDPAVELNAETLCYFPRLAETLAELYEIHATAAEIAAPMTAIGAKVSETLDYALSERGLVFVDGVARIGKTFAVKAWCAAHPGQARYVQVPSSNDEISFFRALAEALGIGTSRAYKALELRARIEAVLHTGDLLIVLDEAHYTFPQRSTRRAVPRRVNWILTELVNMGVPVALITTPQFAKSQAAFVRAGGWSEEQLIGRILHYERLPVSLGEEDLEAVARHWMPGGGEKAIRALIKYAEMSQKCLQGIESLVRRARFVAKKGNRVEPTFDDLASALKDGVVPSDNALASALSGALGTTPRRGARKASVEPLQAPYRTAARATQAAPVAPVTRGPKAAPISAFTPPVRDTGGAVLSVPSDP